MAFDKELYWARRKAGLHGDGRPRGNKTKYSNFEVEAMEYHRRVMALVDEGKITKEEAETELKDAGAAAAQNLATTGAPEIVVAVIEQLIIHGSYEKLQELANKEGKSNAKTNSSRGTGKRKTD